MKSLIALLLTACVSEPPSRPPVESVAGCDFDAASLPTLGERGRIGFGYFPAASEALDRPIAAGGAHANVLGFSSVSVELVNDVRSSDPSVASFKLAAIAQSSCQHQYLVTAHSGQPGSAELILVDSAGAEVDRVTITVAATETLLFDRGWDASPPMMLAGSLQGLHVTTVGEKDVLVGTGAVRFSLTGHLSVFPDGDAEPPWWGGDEVTFTGTPGSGVVIADSGHAHLEVPIEVVDETVLTRLELTSVAGEPLTREVFVTASAGDTPIYGAECQWRWPLRQQPLWVDGGWIGTTAVTRYRFTVEKAGTYSALCVLPGGTNQTIELTFEEAATDSR